MMERIEGWESRLTAVIEAARATPYVLGEHDCFRLACRVIEALTGVDRWPEWAGRYATRRECLALLATHGHNFTEAGNWFFGAEPVSWRQARRGDILEYRELSGPQAGEAHLVVCQGERSAGLLGVGFVFVPTAACAHAWRVG